MSKSTYHLPICNDFSNNFDLEEALPKYAKLNTQQNVIHLQSTHLFAQN